jgi:hypothetical protein
MLKCSSFGSQLLVSELSIKGSVSYLLNGV